jgi:chemotaxis protein MotB
LSARASSERAVRHERALARRLTRRQGTATRDRWLISYADFMTLLFAFFTTMYAISTVDASKLSSVAVGMQTAFDSATADVRPRTPTLRAAPPAGRGIAGLAAGPAAAVPDARTEIERALGDMLSSHRLQLTADRRGLVLTIPEATAFPAGSADMSPAFEAALTRLSDALQRLPHGVRVEGHTDDMPIHTPQFSSNWELSTARATHVVQFLIQRGALAPGRLSAAGYAEFHPVGENATLEGRAHNRRVDVIVLNAATSAAEEPPANDPNR